MVLIQKSHSLIHCQWSDIIMSWFSNFQFKERHFFIWRYCLYLLKLLDTYTFVWGYSYFVIITLLNSTYTPTWSLIPDLSFNITICNLHLRDKAQRVFLLRLSTEELIDLYWTIALHCTGVHIIVSRLHRGTGQKKHVLDKKKQHLLCTDFRGFQKLVALVTTRWV